MFRILNNKDNVFHQSSCTVVTVSVENTCWFKSVFSQHAHLSLCVCRTQSLQANLQNIVLKRVIYSPFISLHSMLTAAVDKSSLISSLSIPQKPRIVWFFKSLCLYFRSFPEFTQRYSMSHTSLSQLNPLTWKCFGHAYCGCILLHFAFSHLW